MAYVNFVKSKNLTDSISNSKSNSNKVHFPTNDESIILAGKKYGVPTIKGKLNLTSTTDIKSCQSLLNQTNEVAFYLVTDSNGSIPSKQSAYNISSANIKQLSLSSPNVTVNAALQIATANVNINTIGVNVGDLIALTRVMIKVSDLTAALGINLSLSGEIEMYQYKILSMNDAKATGHSEASAGVMGLMSPWDKGQVNKVGTIESNLATASNELNRGNKKTMFTADNYNIDQCLDGGIYLYGRSGRSMSGNHSDEYYIVSVDTRYNRSDSKYYVTQRVYSVNYKNRAFERLIVTSATNNYNGTYNNWIQLSEEQYMSEGDVNDFVTIRNWYNSVIGTDSDKVINKYQEIVSFLANIPEGDTLDGIITALETAIDNQTTQHQTDIGNINTEITKINNGTTTVGKATKATQDANGKVIADTYMTKADASKVKGFSSASSIAYKKVTISDSNTDGYGIFIYARQQVYLMTSNCIGGTTFMGHLWELGTNHNGSAISTSNRYIHVKAVKSSNNDSPTTLYIALDAHTYFQIQTSGEITIADSTATEWNGITSSTAGWVSCTYANFNNTTYGVATTSANGLMSSTDKTNLNNALNHLDSLDEDIADIIDGTTVVGASKNAQIAEKATKDGGGKVIATTYLTKTDASNTYATKSVATTSANGLMNTDMVRKIDNIQLSVDKKVPIIQMLQEAYDHQVLIPYMQNDIAYPIKRGGYIKVFVDGVENTGIDDTMCNGMPDFEAGKFIGVTKTSVVTIEIDGAKMIDAASSAFITFPAFWLIPTNIKLEVKTLETDEWTVVKDVTDNATACFACNTTSYTYRYLKYTISGFPSTKFRVCEIGVATYNSGGLRNIVLPLGGGEMYGNITPYKNNGASLGSADKAWATMFSTSHYFKRGDGGLAFLGAVGNNVALYTKNSDDSALFVFDDAAKSFRRGGNSKDLTIGQNSHPWKNVYGKQLTSTAADGTAPLVVSSKTMVANLFAQYASMLFSSNKSPVAAGNALQPVHFAGGVPVGCDMSKRGNRWGVLPFVGSSGDIQIGKRIDFNNADGNTASDNTITSRPATDADGAGLTLSGNTIASGKFAQYSGSVYAVATLSSYWAKLWSFSLKNSNSDRNITMYVTGRTANHTESSGIIKIRMRFGPKTVTNNGVSTVTIVPDISLRQIVGNIDISEFKLYYKVVSDDKGNISQGDFELWCNTTQIWGYRSAVILNSSAEGGGDNNAYKGTFFKNSFTTVQTPTLPNYVEMTNVVINQTSAKALAADKAYNADNATNANKAFYLRTVNNTNADTDFPILWGGSDTFNVNEVYSTIYRSYNGLSYNPSKKRITTGLFKGCIESVVIPSAGNQILQYFSGQPTLGDAAGNAKEGSNEDHNLWSYPKGSTGVNETHANVQVLRLQFNTNYFHDIFVSPNKNTIWHRHINNGAAGDWMKIVETNANNEHEDGIKINSKTWNTALSVKNKDHANQETKIYNTDQGTTVIRHTNENGTNTDLRFKLGSITFEGKQLAYASDVTNFKPKTLANGGYINTLQEGGNAQFIPFLQNEFAHLIERGGSVSVAINGTEYTRGDDVAGEATERKKFFDGCNSYYQIGSSAMGLQDTITITINLPNSYSYSGTIYCLMPNYWRGRNVKFELFYPSLNNNAGKWHTMYEGTNLSDGLVYQPIKTLYDANGNVLVPVNTAWTKLRVTITNFISKDITLRIAEIGYVSHEAKNASAICLPRNGGEIYGGIIPLNNSSYDLGSSSKKWKKIYANNFEGLASKATADASGNNIVNTYAKKTTATVSADGLMSKTDKANFDAALIHLDTIDSTLAGIPNTYATKNSLNSVSTTATTASTNATNALSKVNGIINGTTIVPTSTNAQTAQTATNLTGKPVFAKGTKSTNAVTVTVGGQKSTEFTVPYATNAGSATKATQDGSGNNIANTYATKTSLNSKVSAIDVTALMALNGAINNISLLDLAKNILYTYNGNASSARYYGVNTVQDTTVEVNPSYGYVVAETITSISGGLTKNYFIAKVSETGNSVKCTEFTVKNISI